ncbi:serine/threonine-protein kinase [Embleya scabrispora]|uniref:serine/threonine-protein kinase n=1 Tax=Embleya scabrispora TaxID=159449 RepID=UPI00037EDEA0|nr:serine/threonine-protein kinase [Embleya scabrispora]MYS87067.1 protein kinase [Streptomyces sp. SID5474]
MDADNEGRLIGGRYLLADRLGRGGMGAVWRARDQVLGREVAVKEMLPQPGADDAERARLRERAAREARAAARLSHPSVVRVYDVVEEDDRPWIVMELVPSRSLAEVIRGDGPMAADRVAEIGLTMIDALRTAHAAGILHRDVKPGNVLITLDDRAVLSDFGIAVVEGDSSVTQSGVVLGAPAYIPPERAKGLNPTAASDLWSLGATLYAAVEGKAPFERSTPLATLTAIVSEDPTPAKHAGALDPVLRALLARDPQERPDAAEAEAMLRDALREIREENAATRAVPIPPVPLLPRPAPEAESIPAAVPAVRADEPDPDEIPRTAVEMASPLVPPPGKPAEPVREDRPARTFPWLPLPAAIAALVVFGVVVGLILFLIAPEDDKKPTAKHTGSADSPAAQATSSASPSAAATAPAEGQPTQPPPSTDPPKSSPSDPPAQTTPQTQPPPAADSNGLPAGWTSYTGGTSGYRIGLPPGWTRLKTVDSQEFFANAEGTLKLNVDTVPSSPTDPVEDWKELEPQVRGNFPNYRKLSIEKATYRDYPAAAWHFTYGSSTRHHVLNLGFTVPSGRGYSLYLDTPEAVWDDPATQELLAGFKSSFQP